QARPGPEPQTSLVHEAQRPHLASSPEASHLLPHAPDIAAVQESLRLSVEPARRPPEFLSSQTGMPASTNRSVPWVADRPLYSGKYSTRPRSVSNPNRKRNNKVLYEIDQPAQAPTHTQ